MLYITGITQNQINSVTYMHIREADPYLMQVFGDDVEVDELERDGGDRPRSLHAPALVKRVDGSVAVQTQRVVVQLRQVIEVRGGACGGGGGRRLIPGCH